MPLFLTMLPYYLMGNLHCLGMCGPLVMMIGLHRFRNAYFFGRMVSFGLTGMAAGEAGTVLQGTWQGEHLAGPLTVVLGIVMLAVALANWTGRQISLPLPKSLRRANLLIAELMLKDKLWATFLFGVSTVLLPCGQTLVVFSACALTGDPWTGLFNGVAFALLTSPSLWIAMHALRKLQKAKQHYHQLIGIGAFTAGILALCRGLAEMNIIPHAAIGTPPLHIVFY